MFDTVDAEDAPLASVPCEDDWFDPAWLDQIPEPPDTDQPPVSECAPSGWLALELDHSTADPTVLSDKALIDTIIGFDRIASWASARQARLLAEFARRSPRDYSAITRSDRPSAGSEFASDEIGLALRLSRTTATGRLVMAETLATDLPGTLAAWQAGTIDTRKARAITETSYLLVPELRGVLEARVLPRAATHPRGMDARRADLLAELLTGRRCAATGTWVNQDCPGNCDSTDDLSDGPSDAATSPAPGPAAQTHAPPTGTQRTGCTDPAGHGHHCDPTSAGLNKPLISVVVPITMLLGLDEQPSELVGHGPIPAGLAREIAAEGTWRRLLTDPVSGTLLDYGRTTYTPPAGLADFVRARDLSCRFPTCSQRAATADLDHTIPYQLDGITSDHNLHASCCRHHRLKTHTLDWHVEQHPDDTITWTTPTGHTYTSHPHNYRPEPHPPPGDEPPPF
jgi:hypothetical protein